MISYRFKVTALCQKDCLYAGYVLSLSSFTDQLPKSMDLTWSHLNSDEKRGGV